MSKKISKKVLGLALVGAMLYTSTAPSFASMVNYSEEVVSIDENQENVFDFEGIENLNITTKRDDYIEYTFSKDGENFIAKENMFNSEGNNKVLSEIYRVDNSGESTLIKKMETIIDADDDTIEIQNEDGNGNIINIENNSLSGFVSEEFGGINTNSLRYSRAATQYGVYKYHRTIYGYRNVKAIKHSIGILMTVIATMVGGPPAAFVGIAGYIAGNSYGEFWTVTKVYRKYNKNLRHRTKFVMTFYSDPGRKKKFGPTVSYVEKGLR